MDRLLDRHHIDIPVFQNMTLRTCFYNISGLDKFVLTLALCSVI